MFEGIEVYPVTEVNVKELFYEHFKTNGCNGHLSGEKKFVIWKGETGRNNRTLYIFSRPGEPLQVGKSDLCLKVVDRVEVMQNVSEIEEVSPRAVGEMMKSLRVDCGVEIPKERDAPKASLDDFLTDDHEIFYEIANPIRTADLISLSEDQLADYLSRSIDGGYSIDPTLEFIMRTHLVHLEPEIAPSSGMKYNNHSVIVTGTKTGKTSIAERVGSVYTMARVSRLLGFSTADSDYEGLLHMSFLPVFLDEVQEEGSFDLYGFLLELIEGGVTRIAKGRTMILCKSYSPLVVFANPKTSLTSFMFSSGKELDMSLVFQDLLSKITSNYGAFASRLGIVYFNQDARAAQLNTIYTDKDLAILGYLGKAVSRELSTTYSQLLTKQEVLTWLNTPYPGSYKNVILTYAKAAKIPMFRVFIAGHLESHKHARGTALKSALVKLAYPILHGAVTTEEILLTAEDEMTTVMAINQSSIKRLSGDTDLKSAAAVVHEMLKEESDRVLLAISALKGMKGEVSKSAFEASLDAVISAVGSRYSKGKLCQALEKSSSRVIPVFEKYGIIFNPVSLVNYFVVTDSEFISSLNVASILGGRKSDSGGE